MDVDVEIQRAAPGSPLRRLCAVGWKSLDDRDRAAAAVRHAVSARAAAQETEHRSEIHGHDRPTEVVIPGEEIPNPMRQAQHPLPHGHVGNDVIDPVGSAFGHPAPTAARTESAPFTREGHQSIQTASLTTKPSESARQAAAAQKIAELLFDEPRQALAVSERRGLGTERLEMFEHDLIERTLRR